MAKYIAVTGGLGFIGKHVVRRLLERGDYVYLIDCLTYAADLTALAEFQRSPNLCFVNRDIRDPELSRLPDVDALIHLAAETHVDNSIDGPVRFTEVNVLGTHHLLELVRRKGQHGMPRFIYISTDEVYGPIPAPNRSRPHDALRPSSPYAVSKAGADLLGHGYRTSFGVPTLTVRPTNCFGVGQYVEKLIPRAIQCGLLGRAIPVHGDGSQTRQWLHVEDCARAILTVLDQGEIGGIYNVSGVDEVSVRDIAEFIARETGGTVQYGFSRPGQDQRYAVDDSAIQALGWRPERDFWQALPGIIAEGRKAFRF